MFRMKHLAYNHTPNRTLVETMGRAIRRVLPVPLRVPPNTAGPVPIRRRILYLTGWILTIAIQAALLVLLSELVEVIHGVMSLYLDLAEQQLELTHLYVAATGP